MIPAVMSSGTTFSYRGRPPQAGLKYKCAIIPEVQTPASEDEKAMHLRSIIRSVKRGGSIIFLHESTSNSGTSTNMHLNLFRRGDMPRFGKFLVPSGTVRVPVFGDMGMYGHQYRKII